MLGRRGASLIKESPYSVWVVLVRHGTDGFTFSKQCQIFTQS